MGHLRVLSALTLLVAHAHTHVHVARSRARSAAAPRPAARALRAPARAAPLAVAAAATGAPSHTAIVGGGPAGLATAIMLAQRGWTNIHVYDRLPAVPAPDDERVWLDTARDRFYLIGLGGRGQESLQALGVWDAVAPYTTTVVGRRDWAPGDAPDGGAERIFTAADRKYMSAVIARDRLVGALDRAVAERYGEAVTVHHGVECASVQWDAAGEAATLRLRADDGAETDVTTELLVGADGAARGVASAMAAASEGFHVVRYEDDNAKVFKTLPMSLPPDWRPDLNYAARTADGRVYMDALPRADGGRYCGVLILRADDELAQPSSAAALRALLDEAVPQFSACIDDDAVAHAAARPAHRLPNFRAVAPTLHHGSVALMLGDAIHTVKPYFGMGANSAFEDVIVLRDALDGAAAAGAPLGAALPAFSDARAADARTLVRLSRDLDRPGVAGAFTFIIPVILDAIFHRLAPRLFAPSTILMLQREGVSYRDVAARKRQDRALQLVVLAAALGAAGLAARAALGAAASALRAPAAALLGAVARAVGGAGSTQLAASAAAPIALGGAMAACAAVGVLRAAAAERSAAAGGGALAAAPASAPATSGARRSAAPLGSAARDAHMARRQHDRQRAPRQHLVSARASAARMNAGDRPSRAGEAQADESAAAAGPAVDRRRRRGPPGDSVGHC